MAPSGSAYRGTLTAGQPEMGRRIAARAFRPNKSWKSYALSPEPFRTEFLASVPENVTAAADQRPNCEQRVEYKSKLGSLGR
jgi:hypothetical protein